MPVLLIILIGLVGWMIYSNNKPTPEPKPYIITIPGAEGSTGTQILRETQPIPVYIPGKGEITVDDTWRKLYLEAKDSLEKQRVFDQAIAINKYDTTFIDNDTLKVSGQLETRGELTKYKFDWELKERKFEYTPEVIIQRPKFSVSVEATAGIPTVPTTGFLMKGQLGFENRRGNALTVGYDTEQRVWLGVRKNIILIK